MIKIEKTKVYGWEEAIRGMRNPMNSWSLSDTELLLDVLRIGEKDLDLMKRLRNAGTDHRKYMRLIDADALKEKLLKERDAIPLTYTERYGFGVEFPSSFGQARRFDCSS